MKERTKGVLTNVGTVVKIMYCLSVRIGYLSLLQQWTPMSPRNLKIEESKEVNSKETYFEK